MAIKKVEWTVVCLDQPTDKDFDEIESLEKVCRDYDGVALKLELEYKRGKARQNLVEGIRSKEDFVIYDEGRIIAYAGICGYDGMPIEVAGMVHPNYRRKGCFFEIFRKIYEQWMESSSDRLLLLSDRRSEAGKAFVESTGGVLDHAEFEMITKPFVEWMDDQLVIPAELSLRKASNADALEIKKQNAIYFGMDIDNLPERLPEAEEKLGLTTWLAVLSGEIVGKVSIQYVEDYAAIFGLGVLPPCRGKGYGRAILKHALAKMRETGAKRAMLQVSAENETALTLYTSCGFEIDSTMEYFIYRKTDQEYNESYTTRN